MRLIMAITLAVLWAGPSYATSITAALFDGFQGLGFGGPTGGLGGLNNYLQSQFGSSLTSQEFNLFEDFSHLQNPDPTRQAQALSFVESHAANSEVVLIGHSRGGEETQTFAQQLLTAGVPVNLTVQIDPVYFQCLGSLTGDCPQTVTAGVQHAVNYYETNSPGLNGDHPIIGAQNINLTSTGDCHITIAGCTGIAQDPRVWSLIAGDIRMLDNNNTVPEPTTWILLVTGVMVFMGSRWTSRRLRSR